MKIQVITKSYREEFLIPLLVMHYEPWVDEITILTQKFPGGKIHEQLLTDWTNEAIAHSNADWVLVVDTDEFAYPLPRTLDPRATLEAETGDIIMCKMVRVWRHVDDEDIDRLKPPLEQRRHGIPDHHKACIFRPSKGVRIGIGVHTVSHPPDLKWGADWSAAHWANADPVFGVERRIRDRRDRLSDHNLANGFGVHEDDDRLPEVYQSHMFDPIVVE